MTKSLTRPTDGTVMCCICFNYFTLAELAVDTDGQRWDVCIECWKREQFAVGSSDGA